MAGGDEAWIDFVEEELLVLHEAGVPLPVGFGDAPDLPEEAWEYLASRARESLTAREVLVDGKVDESVQALFEIAGEPGLVCSCAVERNRIVETAFFTLMPELGVEHQSPAANLHRFVPFAPAELLVRVARNADLRPAALAPGPSFEASVAALEAADLHMSADEREAARTVLLDDGVGEAAVDGFIDALGSKHSTVAVTILHRTDVDELQGGQLTWIDCGLSGIWMVDVDNEVDEAMADDGDEADPTATVTAVIAEDIVAELLSYLPAAFSDETADADAQASGSSEGSDGSS